MLLMESVSKIRRWVLVEGRSIRSVARATGLSRNTIKKYLKDESPPSYQRQAPPVRHKLCNGFDLRLQELFDQDQKRPRRERRTAQKLYEQLVVAIDLHSLPNEHLSVAETCSECRCGPCDQLTMTAPLTTVSMCLLLSITMDYYGASIAFHVTSQTRVAGVPISHDIVRSM